MEMTVVTKKSKDEVFVEIFDKNLSDFQRLSIFELEEFLDFTWKNWLLEIIEIKGFVLPPNCHNMRTYVANEIGNILKRKRSNLFEHSVYTRTSQDRFVIRPKSSFITSNFVVVVNFIEILWIEVEVD